MVPRDLMDHDEALNGEEEDEYGSEISDSGKQHILFLQCIEMNDIFCC